MWLRMHSNGRSDFWALSDWQPGIPSLYFWGGEKGREEEREAPLGVFVPVPIRYATNLPFLARLLSH